MREPYDFSTSLIRASALYHVLSGGKTKTPRQKYEDAVQLLDIEAEKYYNMTENTKVGKRGIDKLAKIAAIENLVSQLEATKDQDPLSIGAKSYLKRLYGEIKYNKWSPSLEKGNKYTEKGKLAEPDSIKLIEQLDSSTYFKNEERFENEFICGHPDIIDNRRGGKYIIDVKTSWDFETFAENIGKPLNPLYFWQLQAYMWLTDSVAGEVSYCLVNTPENILKQECDKLLRSMNVISELAPEYIEAEKRLIRNMTFDDMHPLERRLKFVVHRDDSCIEKIKAVVPKCRDCLFEIQETHILGNFTSEQIDFFSEVEA